MFPAEADARAWTTLTEIRLFTGLRDEAWDAVHGRLGDLNDTPRNLALLPDSVLRAAASAARLTPAQGQAEGPQITPVDAAQLGLTWRISRRMMTEGAAGWTNFADSDPMVPQAAAQPASSVAQGGGAQAQQANTAGQGSPDNRKLKMAAYLDQADDSEFSPAPRSQVETWFQNYRTFALGAPEEDEEPTAEQLQALHVKVSVLNSAPYADLAIWGPFNRKVVRAMKFVAWLPQPDGTYLKKDIPGPANFASWLTSWRVFRTACIMLDVVAECALTRYSKRVERLSLCWPEAWHLIALADDKMRAEGLERTRRRIESAIANGSPPPQQWSAAKPWTSAFLLAADDDQFWNEQVRDLATSWIARGGRGALLAPDEQIAAKNMRELGGKDALHVPAEQPSTASPSKDKPWGEGQSKGAKQRKRKRDQPTMPQAKWGEKGKGSTAKGSVGNYWTNQKGGDKGKGKGKQSKDASGKEICYSWGFRQGSCKGDNACPNNRAHCCQWCLSTQHRTMDCPQHR